jgi:hypothetical protein
LRDIVLQALASPSLEHNGTRDAGKIPHQLGAVKEHAGTHSPRQRFASAPRDIRVIFAY